MTVRMEYPAMTSQERAGRHRRKGAGNPCGDNGWTTNKFLKGDPLLIIDDFGMERGTEYALEQIYNIVDSRYRSRKPLIVTTNLTLDEIRHPQDTAHARIYDRLLEMCVPVSCIGVSLRKENALEKLERLKILIG